MSQGYKWLCGVGVVVALLYGLLVAWEARHPLPLGDGLTAEAQPTFAALNLTYVEESAALVTLSADLATLTLTTAAADTLRLCAAQPEGEPTCISLLELRERRD